MMTSGSAPQGDGEAVAQRDGTDADPQIFMNLAVESPYGLCVRVCLQRIDHVGVPEDII
jgi:hypothetical protein